MQKAIVCVCVCVRVYSFILGLLYQSVFAVHTFTPYKILWAQIL